MNESKRTSKTAGLARYLCKHNVSCDSFTLTWRNDCIERNIKRIKEKGRRDGERERDGQKI